MTRTPIWLLVSALSALGASPAQPSVTALVEHAGIAQLFAEAQVTGTLVVRDFAGDRWVGHGRQRAALRFSPASTFKLANSLIGLEVGAVASVDEPLPYRGPAEPFIPAWANDMPLRQAFPMSNVPIYQELARRIGLDRMREQVARLDYGNQEVGETVDTFWLDGPLAVSAVEQIRFLTRLAQGELPLRGETQAAVREIALIETGPDWALHGKTGWQNAPGPGVGWWVGWLERGDALHVFALNLDLNVAADAPKRVELGRAALRLLGLLPPAAEPAAGR